MTSVLCVGIAVYDQIFALKEFPSKPTKNFATDFASAPGGPAANGAVTVVRQGGQATLWARVGGDMQGERIVAELAATGVDISRVRRVAGCRSGTTAVGVTPDGERMILAFADPTLDTDPSWLPLDEVGRHDAVLADVRWPAASREVLAQARSLGVPSVLDADLTPDKAALRALIPLASHVVFSEPALADVTGMAGDFRPALEAVFAAGEHEVVGVTLGQRGCAWCDRDGFHEEPGLPIRAIDTLAAGDVFHGAYALAQARRLDPRGAARFANVVAGLKCTRWGGGSTIPAAEEVERFLARDFAALEAPGELA
jgi:sulfofructose kinase